MIERRCIGSGVRKGFHAVAKERLQPDGAVRMPGPLISQSPGTPAMQDDSTRQRTFSFVPFA